MMDGFDFEQAGTITPAGESTLRELLGSVQTALDQEGVSEVICNEPHWLDIEQDGVWRREPAPDLSQERIESIGILAASLTGQDLTPKSPICYAILPNGERLTIARYPVIRQGKACLVVRRRGKRRIPFGDLCAAGLFDEAAPAGAAGFPLGLDGNPTQEQKHLLDIYEIAASKPNGPSRGVLWYTFFKLAMERRQNMVLVGKPGSGKTTLMESLIGLIPADCRLATVEDTAELELEHPNATQLYHSKGDLTMGKVSADDLAELILRLYPDLALFGELRDRSALPWMRIVAAGNPGMATAHATSARHAFQVLSLMLRMHPASAHIEDRTLEAWLRDTVDIVAHLERRKVPLPDGGVRQEFRCTQVYFRPAAATSSAADKRW